MADEVSLQPLNLKLRRRPSLDVVLEHVFAEGVLGPSLGVVPASRWIPFRSLDRIAAGYEGGARREMDLDILTCVGNLIYRAVPVVERCAVLPVCELCRLDSYPAYYFLEALQTIIEAEID